MINTLDDEISYIFIYGNIWAAEGVLELISMFLAVVYGSPLLARVCAWDCCAGLLRFCGVEKTRVNEKL